MSTLGPKPTIDCLQYIETGFTVVNNKTTLLVQTDSLFYLYFPESDIFLWFNYDAGSSFQSKSSEAWLPSISGTRFDDDKMKREIWKSTE